MVVTNIAQEEVTNSDSHLHDSDSHLQVITIAIGIVVAKESYDVMRSGFYTDSSIF